MSLIKFAEKLNQQGDDFIRKFGIKDFHHHVCEMLLKSSIHDAFDYQEIINSFFGKAGSAKQNFGNLEFSDLPVTLSRGKNCFIDLYFWRRRPTTIHNHHFSGSFMCLLGNNVDHEFTFRKEQKIGKYFETGKLELKEKRVLKAGEAVPIAPLNKFIHQNHHQADLTVNLCFRTPDLENKTLSNYLYSGLKFEKNPLLLRRASYLRRFIDMGEFDFQSLDLSTDDAVVFLLQNFGTNSGNQRLQQILKLLQKRVSEEHGINLGQMIESHDRQMDQFENDYD
ncbi:MAG: hypothetical protein ACLGHN_00480 [Bacteriovoracia bacterium]